MNEQLEKIISFDFDSVFVPEIFSSLLIILVLLILSLAVFISSRKYIKNPLLTPKGIFNIACRSKKSKRFNCWKNGRKK